ncbi:MAG: response regulator [Hyphomicrobiaceae bacterium]
MSENIHWLVRRQRVLVVDDDPIFTGLAAACLARAGFDVATAADGVEGLELLDSGGFDIALVDLTMPHIDGLRLIALVRGSARLHHLAIVVVSARHDEDAFREALAIGADAVETKPISWAELPERLRSAIAGRHTAMAGSSGTVVQSSA